MEKLEIYLTSELVEKLDRVVYILGIDSRDELVRCAIRRYVDKYFLELNVLLS